MPNPNDTVKALHVALADTYVLYLKTQNYHWNVTGIQFHSLHSMFEEQYKDLAEAVDVIAERIRALGHEAPGSFEDYAQTATISGTPVKGGPKEMLNSLIEGHEGLCTSMKRVIEASKTTSDPVTEDLAIERLDAHEKVIWMLKATLS
ncbi:MAG: DNA starvation/stationary phase protection protein [Legionellales bacterium]|nr:DNA starvation/stationary phase protection protein [Legionellales bacterium]|tara:strand:- start:2099 stop:2542 length:444 start_codon:yes stop_codon:yes gene_type:complete